MIVVVRIEKLIDLLQRHWLRMRNLTVRLIATSIYLAARTVNGCSTLPDLMRRLMSDYEAQLKEWKQFKTAQVLISQIVF